MLKRLLDYPQKIVTEHFCNVTRTYVTEQWDHACLKCYENICDGAMRTRMLEMLREHNMWRSNEITHDGKKFWCKATTRCSTSIYLCSKSFISGRFSNICAHHGHFFENIHCNKECRIIHYEIPSRNMFECFITYLNSASDMQKSEIYHSTSSRPHTYIYQLWKQARALNIFFTWCLNGAGSIQKKFTDKLISREVLLLFFSVICLCDVCVKNYILKVLCQIELVQSQVKFKMWKTNLYRNTEHSLDHSELGFCFPQSFLALTQILSDSKKNCTNNALSNMQCTVWTWA